MDNPSIISELNPKKVGRLLKIYSENEEGADSPSSDQQKALLLRSYLSDALPLSDQVLQTLPVLMRQLYYETSRLEGQSLYELLLDPNTALEDLRVAKEFTKEKLNKTQMETEKKIAIVVYYATIASAMAFHDEKISTNSYEKLRKVFYSLLSKKWIFTELKDLFTAAGKKCRLNLSE
jgi:hypothetical protein